jgi:hypothetical protein
LLFIISFRGPVYDDSLNLLDVVRYANKGVTLATIRSHINATGPTSFIWMATAVRLLRGDELRDARVAVLFAWLLLGIGALMLGRRSRFPQLWYAALMVTLVFPHALTAMSTVLTEGPAMLFALLGTITFTEFADRLAVSARFPWSGILGGLLMGLAVTARQYYVALLPAALILVLLRWCRKEREMKRPPLWKALLPLVVAAIPAVLLILAWGGLSSPGMSSGSSYSNWISKVGLNLFRPVIAAFYVSVYLTPLTISAVIERQLARRRMILMVAIAGGAAAGLANSSLQQPGPLHSMLQLAKSAPGGAAIPLGLIATVAIFNSIALCQLLWEKRAEVFSCGPLALAVLTLLFFLAEQSGVGGNHPFYDRYVFQIAPFLGIVAFGVFPRLSQLRVAFLAILLLVSYGMLWRYALK